MMGPRAAIVLATVVVSVFALGGVMGRLASSSASTSSPAEAQKPGTGDWAVAEAGPWRPARRAFGVVSDAREVRVAASLPVKVLRSDVELGQRVERGQVLATVEAPMLAELISHLSAQRRRAALARQALEDVRSRREAQLARNDQVIQAETALGTAEGARADARHRLAQALASLGHEPGTRAVEASLEGGSVEEVTSALSVVRAPFAGVVMDRGALPGVTMPAGAILYAIEDVASVYVEVSVLPGAARMWENGRATARILGEEVELRATASVPRLDPGTGLLLLRYRAEVPGERQVDGARVAVQVQGPPREVAWVPKAAVVSREGLTWCLLGEGPGPARPVRVRAAAAEGGRVPIIEGLRPGQSVLVRDAYEVLYRDLGALIEFED